MLLVIDQSVVYIERAFKSALNRAGFAPGFRPHDLRHVGLTRLDLMRVPRSVIQYIAGHSTPQMTAKYVHVNRDTMIREVFKAHDLSTPPPVEHPLTVRHTAPRD